jgi:hypothetical protein
VGGGGGGGGGWRELKEENKSPEMYKNGTKIRWILTLNDLKIAENTFLNTKLLHEIYLKDVC